MRVRAMGRRFLLGVAVPVLAGLTWTHVVWVVLLRLHDVMPGTAGTRTLAAIFYNPVMFVWEAGRLPTGGWGRVALYVYYAVLTTVIWNAPGSRRAFHVAAVGYGLHAAAVLLATLVYGAGIPIPGLATYYGWGDLKVLWSLAGREPEWVGLYGLLLTFCMSRSGRLRRGWTGESALAILNDDAVG